MKKVAKPYFAAAIAKNGKNVEKWSGQMSEKQSRTQYTLSAVRSNGR